MADRPCAQRDGPEHIGDHRHDERIRGFQTGAGNDGNPTRQPDRQERADFLAHTEWEQDRACHATTL
jgi:hypothetical protein